MDAGLTLCRQEREVLARVAAGQSRKEIAFHLGISEHTVRAHLRSARARLGARSDAHAVAVALKQGLIGPTHDPTEAAQRRGRVTGRGSSHAVRAGAQRTMSRRIRP